MRCSPIVVGVMIGLTVGVLMTPLHGQQDVRVVDGDTLVLNGEHVRLYGIDAPEHDQMCAGWPAGFHATVELSRLVSAGTIHIDIRGHDRYGRTLAIVKSGDVDVNQAMVNRGMAWAYLQYSYLYANEQAVAVALRRGVHAHDCEKPWDYRARNRKGEREQKNKP